MLLVSSFIWSQENKPVALPGDTGLKATVLHLRSRGIPPTPLKQGGLGGSWV
jgi:hypothetical protein